MKKQFIRVKQLADQTFSRAGKTEVLTDDLQEADRRVEHIRLACQNTGKKLTTCFQNQGLDLEKRIKKAPEHMLGVAMQDCGSNDEDCLLGHVLYHCGQTEQELAGMFVSYEMNIEKSVIEPLQNVIDVDIPNINKHKRNLSKLTLDMDAARTRYHSSMKHNTNTPARLDSIKDEMEEAESKMEQCRDVLASDMFQFISREAEIAQMIVEYIKLKKEFHEKSLKHLEELIPAMDSHIQSSSIKPVFSKPLEEHLQITHRKIALPIELCVCALLELGMAEEGLFRVAGGISKVRRMKMSLDAGCMKLETALEYGDPHVVASALKSYLRELPEPLMTYKLYDDWIAASKNQGDRVQEYKKVAKKLPPANYDNLTYLIKFLAHLSRNQAINKMSSQNIAIVMAPNLIWDRETDSSIIGMNMNSANAHSRIVDVLVSCADSIFPEDIEFYQTFNHFSTNGVNGMSVSMSGASVFQDSSSASIMRGHARSSSGEGQNLIIGEGMKRTQSSSSLSDHSSPPQGSPKPATRRKNKPAPVPPAGSKDHPDKPPRPAGPVASTLPRPAKKPMLPDPPPPPTSRNSVESVEQVPILQQLPSEGEVSHLEISNMSQSTNNSTPTVTVTSGSIGKVSVVPDKVSVNTGSTTLDRRHPPRPIAAPRSSIVSVNSTTDTKTYDVAAGHKHNSGPDKDTETVGVNCGGGNDNLSGVTVRKVPASDVSERSVKPVVPERPATLLRPHASSFRVSKLPSDSDNPSIEKLNADSSREINRVVSLIRRINDTTRLISREDFIQQLHRENLRSLTDKEQNVLSLERTGDESERPMLERAHMYSVDKQQVSIIQVGGEKPDPSPLQRSPSLGGRSQIMPTQERAQCCETSRKTERNCELLEKENWQSSHSRTHSEGNILDIDSTAHMNSSKLPAASPRIITRPLPPPPPVPQENIIESTDL